MKEKKPFVICDIDNVFMSNIEMIYELKNKK